MKKTILKLLPILLTMAIVCSAMCALRMTVSAAHSGKWGNNLTWELDDNGMLTISGTGEMQDNFTGDLMPWNYYDDKIISVQINNGVTSIGNSAFIHCDALTSVTIPASVTSIGERAFNGFCFAFESIQVDINNPVYTSVDGVLYNKDKTQLIRCPEGKNKIEILNSVTSIADYAFYRCKSLTDITIPDNVESIGEHAFFGCDALESITIPNGVTRIKSCTFSNCDALASVILPNSVTYIEGGAFYNCDALTSIIIPNSEAYIGRLALESHPLLTIYGCSGSHAQMYADDNGIPFVAGTAIGDKFFSDVAPSAWYANAVQYAADHNLFNGISAIEFTPSMAMNRAMLVTVLWRMEGQPVMSAINFFDDVPEKEYYTKAVLWAAWNGIVNGIGDDKFDPKGNITREQMATILYRYAREKGYSLTASADLNAFPDGAKTSDYAKTALSWACGAGLIAGSDGKLLPQDGATRAQVATILMRYDQNIAG